ncbi:vacuolar protein sorting 36 containing protein, variant [Loa loa]|nr:vacuolar protein sorting 36 containing protein [Loa loa]XP_020307111.1 vacuolar protein sorting 36 containing protein, variant [Loa loa]EFO18378.2 vacuolar protein sorting 36 containing protein [Loa loa]EJD76301.1 vacuolar protein sorting 36 containing protein, variant [Loa loa]
MDRLTWYQPGEYMEDIIIQSGHVSIYDGDVKQTTYEQGTASLTLHRIIWADSNDPDHRLILHHSLVAGIEKHHKSMFRRGGKIILSLHPKPLGQQRGPFASSSFNYIRLVFRNGGEDEFFEKYKEALGLNTWERIPSGCATSGPVALRNCNTAMPRVVGILGIEKRLAENHHRTHESISQAFEDMNRLMEYAREMVSLSKVITDKLRARKGEITDDETIRFKTYLLSLGVSDPVTKSTFGSSAEYYKKLAEELTAVLCAPLKECGGMMTLSDVYCRINRARGLELLSPEDILNACQMLEQMNLPISLNRFESGVMVVQLKEMSVETTIESTAELVAVMGTCNATKLAKCLGITVILAKERLLAAEAQAKLCRDDTVEGLTFYPNRFMTSC